MRRWTGQSATGCGKLSGTRRKNLFTYFARRRQRIFGTAFKSHRPPAACAGQFSSVLISNAGATRRKIMKAVSEGESSAASGRMVGDAAASGELFRLPNSHTKGWHAVRPVQLAQLSEVKLANQIEQGMKAAIFPGICGRKRCGPSFRQLGLGLLPCQSALCCCRSHQGAAAIAS